MSSPIRRTLSEPRIQPPRPVEPERLSRDAQQNFGHKNQSRASSTESEIYHDASESTQGIRPLFDNIYYGLHTALSNKDSVRLKAADRLIKKDAHQGLDAALKHERMQMGTQIISYLSGSTSFDHDIPQLTPFNRLKEPCSEGEFERLLKNIQRNYPKYRGKSSELLYFLIEVGQLRLINNITDQQLSRLLTNRFEDRLLTYYMSEIQRGRALLEVVNQIALDYVKTINPSHEVDKYLSFTFKFDNLADELTDLKQAISLAHPRTSYNVIQQMYLDKILSLLPYEQRHDLLDDLNQRDDLIRLGLVSRPYNEHELDNKILHHCRSLDRKNTERRRERRVHQLEARPVSPLWDHPPPPIEVPPPQTPDVVYQVVSELKSLSQNIKKVSEQNSHQIAQLINDRKQIQYQQNHQNPPPQQQQQQHQTQHNNNNINNNQTQYNRSRQQQQQSSNYRGGDRRQQTIFQPSPQNSNGANSTYQGGPPEMLSHDDPRFSTAVQEIQNNFKYVGQKITHDIKSAAPQLNEKLRELRANRQIDPNPYQWSDGKYLVTKSEQINFPIIRKRQNGPPDLTRQALEHFAKLCYACGKEGCQGRGNPRGTCPYRQLPDSWIVCTNCKMGFHLTKDCLARVVEN